MLHTLLTIIHILICVVLVAVVLLQSSKGGGLAGAFGGAGGAPQQMLGSRGMTTLLHKLTVYLAVGFFVTSFVLFISQGAGTTSTSGVVGEAARRGEIETPVQAAPIEVPAVEETAPPAESEGAGTADTDGGQ